MNLQTLLLIRIALIALLCWAFVVSYALYQSHNQARRAVENTAESLGKQLDGQLLLQDSGIGRFDAFPNFDWWKHTNRRTGICVAYHGAGGEISRRVCIGGSRERDDWPPAFEKAYRWIFDAGQPLERPVSAKGGLRGILTVTPEADSEIAEAWQNVRSLALLSGLTGAAVCLLVYWNIRRLLKPVKAIVSSLQIMEDGDLSRCLPDFELDEWHRIGSAINRFAVSQRQLLADRQRLALELMTLQETERRYLARELHDEFGQCLAAVNAVASTIRYSAGEKLPSIAADAEQIGRITGRMLETVKTLLGRIRAAELEELGLESGLQSLVADWKLRNVNTRYRLSISGDCGVLQETIALAVFRIAQECLTNIAKHAMAADVSVSLTVEPNSAELKIQDNGIANQLPFASGQGIGLLGMRERVLALNGRLDFQIAQPQGLIVSVSLPVTSR